MGACAVCTRSPYCSHTWGPTRHVADPSNCRWPGLCSFGGEVLGCASTILTGSDSKAWLRREGREPSAGAADGARPPGLGLGGSACGQFFTSVAHSAREGESHPVPAGRCAQDGTVQVEVVGGGRREGVVFACAEVKWGKTNASKNIPHLYNYILERRCSLEPEVRPVGCCAGDPVQPEGFCGSQTPCTVEVDLWF